MLKVVSSKFRLFRESSVTARRRRDTGPFRSDASPDFYSVPRGGGVADPPQRWVLLTFTVAGGWRLSGSSCLSERRELGSRPAPLLCSQERGLCKDLPWSRGLPLGLHDEVTSAFTENGAPRPAATLPA